jgi:RNA polymerase sigma-70 factor, ECF subfamily
LLPIMPSEPEFDRLYEATYPRILRTLATILGDVAAAEDCAQDAFLKAFRSWETWKGDAPVEAWLHRIAINVAISYRRKRALLEIGELVRRLGRPEQPDPTDQGLGGDLLNELRRLPAKQAAALVLRHLHGYSNREIAAALGVPESTVATRLMTAKRTLRARLGASRRARSDTSATWRVPPIE